MILKRLNASFPLKIFLSIFGPESFIAHIKEVFYFKAKAFEVPESKKLASDAGMIIQEVCKYYGIVLQDLFVIKKRMV